MKNLKNSEGFSALHALLILIVIGIVSFTGWYVWDANNSATEILKSDTDNATTQSSKQPADAKTKDTETWQRIKSAKNGFSLQIPDGWGPVLRPLDADQFLIVGDKQPVFEAGKVVNVTDLESYGSDSPTVFSALIYNNFSSPRGTASTFEAGALTGKKYTYVSPEDTEPGLGEEFKGDKAYEYRFDLGGGNQLVVFYSVYVKSDANDQVATVDKIVKSLRLKSN